jgi:hypothetical protein
VFLMVVDGVCAGLFVNHLRDYVDAHMMTLSSRCDMT